MTAALPEKADPLAIPLSRFFRNIETILGIVPTQPPNTESFAIREFRPEPPTAETYAVYETSTEPLTTDGYNLDITLTQSPATHTYAVDRAPAREDHFRIARYVLQHLLGQHTSFVKRSLYSSDDIMARKLALLYQGTRARNLCARVLDLEVSEVTSGLLHRFYGKISWLDESVVESDQAKAELSEYLYGVAFLREDDLLSLDGFPSLHALLERVPEDLRSWMVQFRRGARLMPIDEWITCQPGRSLYAGMSDSASSVFSVFAEHTAAMLPPREYRDASLRAALDLHLSSITAWEMIETVLQNLYKSGATYDGLKIDFKTHMPAASRAEFYRKVALYAVNPDDEAWLTAAIANATNVREARALSLAIELRSRYSELTFHTATTLAVLLLGTELHSAPALPDAMPTSHVFDVQIPDMNAWSTERDIGKLFQTLGIDFLCRQDGNEQVLDGRASRAWHTLMQTAQFKAGSAPMLDRLNWYGAKSDEQASPLVTQALAGRAIIDHFLGTSSAFPESLEKSLRGKWIYRYSHVNLCAKIKGDIRLRQPHAPHSAIDMLYYLLVREVMPELLVEDVPDHIQYGRSLQSVTLIHGVALLQSLRPGYSVAPHYDDVVKVSGAMAESNDERVHALWARTLIIPALRHAIAHGTIDWTTGDDLSKASAEKVSKALSDLKIRQEEHAAQLNDLLSLKSPDRKKLAQQMLTNAGMGQSIWDQRVKLDGWRTVLQERGFTIASTYYWDHLTGGVASDPTLLELVMMGEVYIDGKPTIPQTYASAFASFRTSFISALSRVVASMLSEISEADRTVLLNSTCEVSRVRFGEEEGDYGLFLRCQLGNHLTSFHEHNLAANEIFYELIPAAGVVRRTEQRFNYNPELVYIESINFVHLREAQKRRQQQLANALVTPLLPLDSSAYLQGTPSRSVRSLEHPRAGELIPGKGLIYAPQGSDQAKIGLFARIAAEHLCAHVLGKNRAEHNHETGWEKIWAKEREYADMAARLLVPFYGCIKDLSQGDHSAGVIAGCIVDSVAALIPIGLFIGSTAKVVMRAGEMSVQSLVRQTGTAVARLITRLAEQSGPFMLRDMTRLTLKVTRSMWTDLRLMRNTEGAFVFEKFFEQTIGGVEHTGRESALNKYVTLDGEPNVAVRDVGTADEPDFRQLDPDSNSVFGKKLTAVSEKAPLEFTTLSLGEGIRPGHYPSVIPVETILMDGVVIKVPQDCRVTVMETEDGVFHILVDDEIYHLDVNAQDAAMRRLAVSKLSPRSDSLVEIENLCRVRRGLTEVPCATGVKLATPQPEPVAAGSTSPKRYGKYPSHAMEAREFTLARLSRTSREASASTVSLDVFVNEGKFCKWAEPEPSAAAGTSTSRTATGKEVIPLSASELTLWHLSEPKYRDNVYGILIPNDSLGLPHNYAKEDIEYITHHCPVVRLESITTQVQDSRSLRGIRITEEAEGGVSTLPVRDYVVVEADTGKFYQADLHEPELFKRFERVSDRAVINNCLRLSEQYRMARERANIKQDLENISRMLFDLSDDADLGDWGVVRAKRVKTYDDYVQWCADNNERNVLLDSAANILSGEAFQVKFVEITRNSIPDFRLVGDRTLPERQRIMTVINTLLPVRGSKAARWEPLTLESLVARRTPRKIIEQTVPANLSFAMVSTKSGQRVVYYSLSGGQKGRDLELSIDTGQAIDQVINDVIYRDARARMINREPDPQFTSLPVLRDADHLTIREFYRQLDAERLIATVLKEDMASADVTAIHFFTVLDTCRSCGGMVLPRLKLDFPEAAFSVTYMKSYTAPS